MKKTTRMFLYLLTLLTVICAGCSSDHNNSPTATTGSVTADATTGTVAAGTMVSSPAGVTSMTFSSPSVLTDSTGAPVTGAITTTTSKSTSASSLPAAPPSGSSLALLLDITMSKGSTQVKNFSTPLTVVVAVPSGITSVDVYSYNGTNWVLEQAGVAVTGGNATFNITHLSMWGCFSVAPLAVTTTSPLPAGTVGTAYSQTLAATGGTGAYTWTWAAATGSALPPGLSLAETTGAISGTPTTAGTYNFSATVTDSASPAKTATQAFSIIVNPVGASLTITSASPLTAGTVGTAYSQTLAASGGTTPYNWTLAPGSSLPAGLTLNAAGVISGTPTTAGTTTTSFTVTDAAAATASKSLSITINAASLNGAALYATNCAGCHGPLATSSKRGSTAAQIQAAINGNVGGMGFLSVLTSAEVQAIATALSP
ncbi:putative Ig domain-containing protein [Pelotalea chapellei]|uniref:Ig domain-containing protein n=1 Tax=Pelotalea chapellei TaxID=44671 RepID=A0ABS5U3K2_9BACT|nr:putative Ig domain-containing protein [Pelotalea chapellei]MBT1070249.1 putative Ig domain-containing protein [Pelotalea chapellei]